MKDEAKERFSCPLGVQSSVDQPSKTASSSYVSMVDEIRGVVGSFVRNARSFGCLVQYRHCPVDIHARRVRYLLNDNRGDTRQGCALQVDELFLVLCCAEHFSDVAALREFNRCRQCQPFRGGQTMLK